MSTLLSIVKVVADIEKMVTNTVEATKHITQLGDTIESLDAKAPTVSKYDALFKSLEVTTNAYSEAKKRLNDIENLPDADAHLAEESSLLDNMPKIAEVANKVFNSTVETIGKTADSIDKLPPKIASLDVAYKKWEQDQKRINDIKNLNGINDIIPDMSAMDKVSDENDESVWDMFRPN
jgi:DNA repair ATPase RecN